MSKSALFESIRKILIDLDPMNIYFPEDQNFDEYDPEIKDILEVIPTCKKNEELTKSITDIFVKYFGSSAISENEKLTNASKNIWNIYLNDTTSTV